jgi:hypothetical protein
MRGKRAVAQEAGLEAASHDVVDVHVPDQGSAVVMADQVGGLIVTGGPVEVGSEARGGVRRVEPGLMQRSAGPHRRHELPGV